MAVQAAEIIFRIGLLEQFRAAPSIILKLYNSARIYCWSPPHWPDMAMLCVGTPGLQ
ncbi:hypothetical protein B0O99DRAFT_615431 [Bisporella sp. PMI_857]|nr:hypothetical protein B0O99DRAFT_615431 [Bisporella sp. PMI_857]